MADHSFQVKAVSGVQPEEDGKLQCLICGTWFRQLGQHVVAKHGIKADDYRQRFGLARSRSLHSSQVIQQRSQRGRELWRDDPELRQRLRPVLTTVDERRDRARKARRATASRPGVQASLATNGAAANQAWVALKDAEFQAASIAAGFADLPTMLAATQGVSAREVAQLLGINTQRVWRIRRRHGFSSEGGGRPPGVGAGESRQCLECNRWYRGLGQHIAMAHHLTMADYRARHPITAATLQQTAQGRVRPERAPLTTDELIRIPHGVQPDDGVGHRLLCRLCGQWYRGLAQHIAVLHQVSSADYRQQFGLAPT